MVKAKKIKYEKLKEKVRELPQSPGVYLMKDEGDKVIYVGKAKSLRHRVGSYFAPENHPEPKTEILVRQVREIDYIQTDSEVDALVLESRLIKEFQPKYNLMLKDQKSHPLLAVTNREDFPRVFITRDRELKNVTYFGPFTDVYFLRYAVKMLQKAFAFRTCTMDIKEGDPKNKYFRPCLLYSLKQCTAPCADRIGKEAYGSDIARLKKFLHGRKKGLIKELETVMKRSSAALQYEKAARYRDQIKALNALDKRSVFDDLAGADPMKKDYRKALDELRDVLGLSVAPRAIDGMDMATLQGGESVGSIVSFVDGESFKPGYRRYKIKTVEGVDDYAMMREVVARRFTRLAEEGEMFPDLLLIDGGIGQLNAVLAQFDAMKLDPPQLVAIAKREELLYIPERPEPIRLERNSNALQLLQQVRDEAHRFAQHYHHTLRDKALFQKGRKKKKPYFQNTDEPESGE